MRHLKFFQKFSISLLPRWLRRKLKKLRSGFVHLPKALKKTALATVVVVGVFLGGAPQDVLAADTIVNYNRGTYTGNWTGPVSAGNNGSPGPPVVNPTQWYWNWTYNTSLTGPAPDPTNGSTTYYDYAGGAGTNNDVFGAINQSASSGGGTVWLSNARLPTNIAYTGPTSTTTNTSTAPTSNGGTRGINYSSNWGATTIAGGTANVTSNVTLQNERGTATYGLGNWTKTGAAALTLGTAAGTTYTAGTFTGNQGALIINATFTGTGTATVSGGFTGNVASGITWTAPILSATGNFTKSGLGILQTTTSNISGGTTSHTGGLWNATTTTVSGGSSLQMSGGSTTILDTDTLNVTGNSSVTVGGGSHLISDATNINFGSLRISGASSIVDAGALVVGNGGTSLVTVDSGNTLNSDTASIGVSNQGTVANNGIWNESSWARIGNGARGIVNNTGVWTNTGLVSVGYGAGTGLVTNSSTGTMRWNSPAGTTNRIGLNSAGEVQNNGGLWTVTGNTQIGGSAANATGTVSNNGTGTNGWYNSGQVTVGGSYVNALSPGQNATGTVTNTGRMDWTNAAESLIGQAAHGTVNNNGSSAVWNTSNNVIVGAGSGGGTVNTSGAWNVGTGTTSATRLDVIVGRNGEGTVNQTGGTWDNRFTNVGFGATGTVTQSGASRHTDNFAIIGNTTQGTYNLNGNNVAGGTVWNTEGTVDTAAYANVTHSPGAIIGRGATGTVNVNSLATWNITNALIVGEAASGNLNILSGGRTNVGVAGAARDMIIGNLATGVGTVTVSGVNGGTRSTLNVTQDLITGQHTTTRGSLYVLAGGQTLVGRNHIIAEETGSRGRDHIDGAGSLLNVTGSMTVGQSGQAGSPLGYSHGDLYSLGNAYAGSGAIANDPYSNWLTGWSGANSWPMAGNSPGLAITGGGHTRVETTAVAAQNAGSQAYIVIDNAGGGSNVSITGNRSTWDIVQSLTLSDSGTSFTRVMNGGLLRTGQFLTMADKAGSTARMDVYGTGGGENSKVTVTSQNFTVANLGQATLNVFNGGRIDVVNGNSIVADKNGSAGIVNIYSGGGKTVNGNMFIANERNTVGTVNVWGAGSFLTVNGNLSTSFDAGNGTGTGQTAHSHGNLYAWGGSSITVTGNHAIGENINALGHDYIDGFRTTMTVGGTLTVGKEGQAGGLYTDNSYGGRYQYDPVSGDWLNDTSWHARQSLTSVALAQTRADTGNDPGLAITRGAYVYSGKGVVGESNNGVATDPNVNGQPTPGATGYWSNGYAVLDNLNNTGGYYTAKAANLRYNEFTGNYDHVTGSYVPDDRFWGDPTFISMYKDGTYSNYKNLVSTWEVGKDLVVSDNGYGYVRVLNGSLLYTGSGDITTTGATGVNQRGVSTIIGNGGGKGTLFVGEGDYLPGYAPPIYGRSVWLSEGATLVGLGTGSRGTLRINDGALGITAGLYIGAGAGSEGEVSVMGRDSTLFVTKDNLSLFSGVTPMTGKGLFSASDHSLTWLDRDAEIRLNGIAQVSTGSILHLEGDKADILSNNDKTIFDMGNYRMTVTNGRIEGIGTITGKDGVHFRSDPTHTRYGFENNLPGVGGHAEIDPGLYYGWGHPCEMDYYGTLRFGHTLSMTGNVVTYFDVNAGYDSGIALADLPGWVQNYGNPWAPEQDLIIVQADPNDALSGANKQVVASLDGTLMLHARLTNYFEPTTADGYSEYLIVQTDSTGSAYKGLIQGVTDINGAEGFAEVQMKPWRFFERNPLQEIRENADGDDELWIKMKLNEKPFESSATTYNERSVGTALDSIYALRDQAWLPFLRHFWYIDNDDQFREALRLYSGEIRAHSMLMPLQNPWTYAHERNGFSRCTGHAFFGPQNRSINMTSGRNLWGSYIHNSNSTASDGNAGEYDLRRNGFAVGMERASQGGNSYAGMMFAFNQGKLNAWRSDAKSDDFQFGLYHGKRVFDTWEWKNYLGMGIQNYHTRRNLDLSVNEYQIDPVTGRFECTPINANSKYMHSDFAGLTMAGSTELAKPFYFGECRQWTVKPFVGLDLAGGWQNRASEYADAAFNETYDINNQTYNFSDLVALDYDSATNIRVYGRPGIMFERGGSNGNLRMGVSYSFLMGGHRYTNVTNQFQFGGQKYNLRGVDDGSGFVTANVGASAYLGKRKLSMVFVDYAVLAGSHSTTHAGQLGLHRNY